MILETIDLTARIGTELKADIETLTSGVLGAELRELLERRGVLVVRGLHMSNEQQLRCFALIERVRQKQVKIGSGHWLSVIISLPFMAAERH